GREVVREVDHRPHLLLRITVGRGIFPHRSEPPFLRIVSGNEVADAWFTEVSGDGTQMVGYFATDVPDGVIEWGYHDSVYGRVEARFLREPVMRLERGRFPREVVEVTGKVLNEKRRGQAAEHIP
ncbi:MAG TPA: hypothetical protein VFS20_06585, partial [Longimicrobium sp.]|nr:hypothetical protein [Longimicrobium sp.]